MTLHSLAWGHLLVYTLAFRSTWIQMPVYSLAWGCDLPDQPCAVHPRSLEIGQLINAIRRSEELHSTIRGRRAPGQPAELLTFTVAP